MANSAFSQTNRYLSVSTALGATALDLRGIRGEEAISAPFLYELDLSGTDPALDFSSIVGKPATVTILRGDGEKRYLNGIVTRFLQAGRDGRACYYRAELRPWFWLLTLTRDSRIFQSMTVPDIATKLVTDLGYASDLRNDCTATYVSRDYCVQYNESAFDFISRRLEEEGIYYYFDHTEDGHKMVLGDDSVDLPACPGLDALAFRPGGDQPWSEPEILLDCTLQRQVTTSLVTVDDFNFETPSTALKSESGDGALKVYEYPAGFSVKSDGESRAKTWLESREAGRDLLSGASTARSLCAGYQVTLSGHFRDDVNAAYVVTRIVFQADSDAWRNSFEAIPAKVPLRSARLTPRPVIAGTQTAIVTGPSGKEVWTDQYGRIKVQFHWDRLGQNDDKSSCWIRVAQSWAGQSWGAFVLPRVGMEVIVSFLEGDPDRPLVTGAVYNGEQTVPYALPDNQTRSTFKTNSSVGGDGFNELRFEDKKGSEEVYLQAQKDMNVLIKNSWTETVHQDRAVTIEEGNETLTVSKGDRTVSVAAGKETHSVKSTRDLTVEGAETHTSKDKFTHKVSGDYVLEVDGSLTIKVAGVISIKSTGGAVSTEAATSLTNKAGTDLTNQGLTVKNDASTELTNKAGATQTVDGGGMLVVKGGMVKIN